MGSVCVGPRSSMRQYANTGAVPTGAQLLSIRTPYCTWFLFSLFAIENTGTTIELGDGGSALAAVPYDQSVTRRTSVGARGISLPAVYQPSLCAMPPAMTPEERRRELFAAGFDLADVRARADALGAAHPPSETPAV